MLTYWEEVKTVGKFISQMELDLSSHMNKFDVFVLGHLGDRLRYFQACYCTH